MRAPDYSTRALPTDVVDRLAKVCGLLGSDQNGERSAAAYQATRILLSAGLTWRELVEAAGARPGEDDPAEIEPVPSWLWRDKLKTCRASSWRLTDWERDFIANLHSRGYAPTEKQT